MKEIESVLLSMGFKTMPQDTEIERYVFEKGNVTVIISESGV